MNREASIKAVLKLIGLILAQHGWHVSRQEGLWILDNGTERSGHPDQVSAVLAGCGKVIGTSRHPSSQAQCFHQATGAIPADRGSQ